MSFTNIQLSRYSPLIGLDDSAPAQTSYYLLNNMVTLHLKQADMVVSKIESTGGRVGTPPRCPSPKELRAGATGMKGVRLE